MGGYASLHIVQVGDDDTVFQQSAPSDTFQRQIGYGRELARQQPGSQLTLISFTRNSTARYFKQENVLFVPLYVKHRYDIIKLFGQLKVLHQEQPIHLISTQNIHEDGWIALLFGHIYRVPVVGQIHYDIFSPYARRDIFRHGWLGQIRYKLALKLMGQYAALRVVGQRTRQQILAQGRHNNVHVIPVPVTMTQKEGIPKERKTPHKRVLFVGRLVPVKNLAAWLKVAGLVLAQDNAVTFEIVGDGPLRSQLEQTADELGIKARVTFRGAVAYEQLSEIYQNADIFLITSNYEGFGRVAVEAYLHQIPVVATKITGIEDIVDDGRTGFLHEPGDLEGMARSILKLLDNDPLRQQMGQSGYTEVCARFNPQELSRRWMELLVKTAQDY